MSLESAKKVGYLAKLPVKGLMKKWNRRWFVLHPTSHEGVVRMEYYDSQETAKNHVGKRTIPLRESTPLNITTGDKLHPYVFSFTSQIGHHVLAADSQPELEDWMAQIKQAVAEDRLRRRRTKGQSVVTASADSSSASFNDSGISYKNQVNSGTYRVTVEENETSKKMNLSGTYSLELTPTIVTLTAQSGAKIFTLSYKFMKNYGKQSGQFHFETGKNSPIGEGKIILVTTCSKEVFGVVHNNIKRLRENRDARRPAPPGPGGPTRPSGQQQAKSQTMKAVPRPQPNKSVEAPPPPHNKRQSWAGGGRPGSRHSAEVVDSTIPGTYRSSKDMEESAPEDPNALYAQVDKSKKTSRKQAEGKIPPYKGKAQPKRNSQPESLYATPYEADPAYRAPTVPAHKSSGTRESRTSYALVELDDNAFDDSFDDDDEDDVNQSNLEPLAEGVTNPLDGMDFSVDTSNETAGLSAFDSAFSPSPQTLPPPVAAAAPPPQAPPPPPLAPPPPPIVPAGTSTSGITPSVADDPFKASAQMTSAPTTGDPFSLASTTAETKVASLPPAEAKKDHFSPSSQKTTSIAEAKNAFEDPFSPSSQKTVPIASEAKNEFEDPFSPSSQKTTPTAAEVKDAFDDPFSPSSQTTTATANASGFGDAFSPPNPGSQAPPPQDTSAFGSFDAAFNTTSPQQQQQQPSDTQVNFADFNFDFGGGNVGSDDPFSNLAGDGIVGTADLANMDFGALDDNFFKNLESIDINDQSNPQNFDQFWTNMDPKT